MPEPDELEQAAQQLRIGISKLRETSADFRVLELMYDATDSEQLKFPSDSRLRLGLVDSLEPWHGVIRGSKSVQTLLWPAMFTSSEDLETLVLSDIKVSNRTIMIDFGPAIFQIALLLHTSPQVYTLSQWNGIYSAHKKSRGFKVAIAFRFNSFVLSFNSFDNVFQPKWFLSLEEIMIPPDVVNQNTAFLQGVVEWIETRSKSARCGSAMAAVRDANKVWYGIGIYTVQELFFRAGLHPLLSEIEVFENPSRTARLCSAFRDYMIECRTKNHEIASASIIDGLLAPTQHQRNMARKKFKVYMKARVEIPKRMAKRIDSFNNLLALRAAEDNLWSRKESELHDVYEPEFSKDAILCSSSLGHLIFGEGVWANFEITHPAQYEIHKDPLTLSFERRGLIGSPTYLDPSLSSFLTKEEKAVHDSWRSINAYTVTKEKNIIWTPLKQFPLNSWHGYHCKKKTKKNKSKPEKVESHFTPPAEFFRNIHEVEEETREKNLFVNRIQTNQVAVGCLEYCGSAIVMNRQGGGGTITLACRGDKNAPQFYLDRLEQQIESRKASSKTKSKGKSKRSVSELSGKAEIVGGEDESGKVRSPKRRRISAEKKLVINGNLNVIETGEHGRYATRQRHRLHTLESTDTPNISTIA